VAGGCVQDVVHLSVVVGNVRMVCSSVTTVVLKCPQGKLHVRVLLIMLLHVHAVVHGVIALFHDGDPSFSS